MVRNEAGNVIQGVACGPGSCRDKGWGGVDEGALCLSSLGCDLFAPRSLQWIALPSGQAPGPHPSPHPPLVPTGPHSVINIHWRDPKLLGEEAKHTYCMAVCVVSCG